MALQSGQPHCRDGSAYWRKSIDIAQAWEKALTEASTPTTRKVALRAAMVMTPDRGGVFDVLVGLVRFGLGGAIGGGAQYISWIHERDFIRALELIIERPHISGAGRGVDKTIGPSARRTLRRVQWRCKAGNLIATMARAKG